MDGKALSHITNSVLIFLFFLTLTLDIHDIGGQVHKKKKANIKDLSIDYSYWH